MEKHGCYMASIWQSLWEHLGKSLLPKHMHMESDSGPFILIPPGGQTVEEKTETNKY